MASHVTPSAAICPACGGFVAMERVDDLRVVEFQATCQTCDWSGTLRELLCAGCHGIRLFEWNGERWCCLNCAHVRNSSPSRELQRIYQKKGE